MNSQIIKVYSSSKNHKIFKYNIKMKNNLILIIVFFLSISATSQSNKFSTELSYPVLLGNIDTFNGVIDLGLKYKLKKTESMNLGISYRLNLLKGRIKPLIVNAADLNHKYSFHHLNIFSEFNLNSVKKLHPFIGLGYTALSYNYEYIFGVNEFAKIKNKKENHNGINLNSGFIYNITSDFYFQTHFHYIRIPQKDPISNKSTGAKYNQLKLGLGFRF